MPRVDGVPDMTAVILQTIRNEPFTCGILAMYLGNVIFQITQGKYGPACYWFAAAQITVTATWLMGWSK